MSAPALPTHSDDEAENVSSTSSTSHDKYTTLLRNDCPQIASCITRVSRLLNSVAARLRPQTNKHCIVNTSAQTTAHLEFEARLGRIVASPDGTRRFVAGVSAACMARLLAAMETSDAWLSATPWTQSVDRFYELPSGKSVRTSTTVASDRDAPELHIEHVTKTDLAHVDLTWSGDAVDAYDVRVSLKEEAPLTEEVPVRVDNVRMVRIKQRRSFIYSDDMVPLWSFDFTLVWRAETYLDALAALKTNTGTLYEVEIECLRPHDYLRKHKSTDVLALDLLLKVSDIFTAGCSDASKTGAKLHPV